MNRKFALTLFAAGLCVVALLTIDRSQAIGDTPAAADEAVTSNAEQVEPVSREEHRSEIEKQNSEANMADVAETPQEPAAELASDPVQQHEPQALVMEEPQEEPRPNEDNGGDPRAPILASRRLSYQAVLTDNLGNALPGPTVDLTFNIYTSGAVLVEGPINVLAVPINDGVVDTAFPVSASTFDGSDRYVGVGVNAGPELAPRILLTSVPYALRVDRVASEELDDNIALGRGVAPMAAGILNIQNGVMAQESIELVGSAHRISTYGSDGLEQIRLYGPSWGELWLNDSVGNQTTVFLSASNDLGGQLSLRNNTGSTRVQALGQSVAGGGEVSVYDEDGTEAIELLGAEFAAEGGQIMIRNAAGTGTIELDGDSGDAALMTLRNTAGSSRITLDGDSTGAGLISMFQNDGSSGVTIDADAGTNIGGLVNVNDSVSANRVRLDGESTGTGGEISVFDDDGSETIELLGAESSTTGGQIILRDAAGNTEITLDGEFGAAGDAGRITTPVLQITGGADLSEDFDVSGQEPVPGMVVCIDEKNPGKLVVSTTSYDPRVAGIVSGAGGVRTGLIMGQKKEPGEESSLVDGKMPVALTGRVYCYVDATAAEIKPGDRLTTSTTPGHAMKLLDPSRAEGAIIGKAMTPLARGEKGLVLVLVGMR